MITDEIHRNWNKCGKWILWRGFPIICVSKTDGFTKALKSFRLTFI